eukprot:c28083_g1_i2 orf=314-4183(+)
MMLRIRPKSWSRFWDLRPNVAKQSSASIHSGIPVCTYGLADGIRSRYSIYRLGQSRSCRKCLFLALRSANDVAKADGGTLKNKINSASLGMDVMETPLEPVQLVQPNCRSGKGVVFMSAGVGATGVLLLLVATSRIFHKDGDDAGVTAMDVELIETLMKTTNKLWDSAAQVEKGVTNVFKSISDRVSGFVTKAVQVGVASIVLMRYLKAIFLSSSEDAVGGVGLWWRLKVATLLADMSGASDNRRKALVEAGNGAVVDWILDAVGRQEPSCRSIQEEAARATAHLLSDPHTCESVLGRPNALSRLFLFTASIQPQLIEGSKHKKLQIVHDISHGSSGRSLLVAAIMDIVTSSCETGDGSSFRPKLPENADTRDISAAMKLINEGGLQLDESRDIEGDGADKGGSQGIGIRVLGGTGIINLQMVWEYNVFNRLSQNGISFLGGIQLGSSVGENLITRQYSSSNPGLWDDLQGRFVAVPLAAWALATWAEMSSANRSKIMGLDNVGDTLKAAVMAPERTVKWHGAVAIRFLLEDKENFVDEAAATWSPALLDSAVKAVNVDDASLAKVALNAFCLCVRESGSTQKMVLEKNLPMMHSLAKCTQKNTTLQEQLVQALEVLSLSGIGLSLDESKRWSGLLLSWVFNCTFEDAIRCSASRILARVLSDLGHAGIPISQTWLAMLLMDAISSKRPSFGKGDSSLSKSKDAKARVLVQSQVTQSASQAAAQLSKIVLQVATGGMHGRSEGGVADTVPVSDLSELLWLDIVQNAAKTMKKETMTKVTALDAAFVTLKAIKSLTELAAEDKLCQQRIIEAGGLVLLRRFIVCDDYGQFATSEMHESSKLSMIHNLDKLSNKEKGLEVLGFSNERVVQTAHIRKHALRLLSILALQSTVSSVIREDAEWCTWMENCANGKILGCSDLKTPSYARATLLNVKQVKGSLIELGSEIPNQIEKCSNVRQKEENLPRYEDTVFLFKTDSDYWRQGENVGCGLTDLDFTIDTASAFACKASGQQNKKQQINEFVMDVVFVHGLCGGPFRTWRVADNVSAIAGNDLIEKVDVDSGRTGTCWPKEWLARDLPCSRLLTVKYKTNFSQWSGATLPLEEVSSMLLEKLLAAGVGQRPVVFVTHSMGGLVVKQMLMQAGQDNMHSHLVKQTCGIVFYSCPHFGTTLANMPWHIGIVFRPAPSIRELRSGSPRLEELNRYIRKLHKGGMGILSFSETKVTSLVEGYGRWALRMEVVPIESAYPGFGQLVVLEGTDHVHSCKPLSHTDPAYTATLHFLQKLQSSVQPLDRQ